MSALLRSFATLILSVSLTAAALAQDLIISTSENHPVSLSHMLSDAKKSDILLIGEAHDNKSHHDMELVFIKSLWEQKVPLAIGLEMIQSDSQEALDNWTSGKMREVVMQAVFEQNWSMDWGLYRDIFNFARENHIPMIALNVPLKIARKVAHSGLESLNDDERKEIPAGTSCDLDNPHTAFLKSMFQNIPNHFTNQKMFTYFCEAQTLRNRTMAVNLGRFAKKHPGTKIVGLTGIWHAIKVAIPDQLEQTGSKVTCTVVLPDVPELSLTNTGSAQADYMVNP